MSGVKESRCKTSSPGGDKAARGVAVLHLGVAGAAQFALGLWNRPLVVLCAIFAPLIAPFDPIKADPLNFLQPPSWTHLMGTDATGMDILSRVIHAPRIDLRSRWRAR
jgi:ABC-type dipeptide/oligopeptide/nickel transport system permease subunit